MDSKEPLHQLIKHAKGNVTSITQEGLDQYLKLGDVTVLHALIQAIPVIGGSLDTLIFSKAEQIRRQRILHYLDSLHKFIELVNTKKIDGEFFHTEAGLSVFEQALRTAMQEAVREKRESLAAFTVSSSSRNLSQRNDHLFLLQLIANMSIAQLLVLLDLAANQARQMASLGTKKFGRMWPSYCNLSRFFHHTDVQAIASERLAKHQFENSVAEVFDGLMSFSVLAFPEEYYDEGGHLRYDCLTVTELGGRIYEYLDVFREESSKASYD